MQYRTHEEGPLTTISIISGAIIVTMDYDVPGCFTKFHSHTFDHWLYCDQGSARIVIDEIEMIISAGDSYFVRAHKRHSVWPLEAYTSLRCVHEHADIHPDKINGEGIPLEWLDRLTDREECHARS